MKETTTLQHECKYFYLQADVLHALLNLVYFIPFSAQLKITIILYLHRVFHAVQSTNIIFT